MIRTVIFSLLVVCVARPLRAQNNIFIAQGKIEFQRTINQFAQQEDARDPGDDDSWLEFSKKVMGNKFKTDYFDLVFSRTKTLYKPGRESPDKPNPFFNDPPAHENVIYNDLDQERYVGQKAVFDQTFLIQDSLRRIKWKITDETRVIAGFNCRRANAIVMDSIYVVAFYTDEILTSGGPESFTGLPGMILQVALPHEHITWVATKVEAVPVTDGVLVAPLKGKKVSNSILLGTLSDRMKEWGKWGRYYMREVML